MSASKDSSQEEDKEEKISIAPSADSSEVFLSPNECLRGLSSVDLMNIAENGAVFQQFVRSMSGDQASPSPTSGRGGSTGAVPKRDRLSPHTPRLSIPVRRNSSSLLRVVSHDGDGERNLRLYLQDSGRSGQDGRCLFRRRLMKEEDDRQRETDLQRLQSEMVLGEDNRAGSVLYKAHHSDCPNRKRYQTRFRLDSVDSGQATFQTEESKTPYQRDADDQSRTSYRSSRRRRKCCPFFCGNDENESSEQFLTRMDRFAEASRSGSRWRRSRNRIRRFFKSAKNSLVRFTRIIFSCCWKPQ